VADLDTAFVQQIFDLPQRQWKTDIHHHGKADNLGRSLEITEWISHRRTLRNPPRRLKAICSDTALGNSRELEVALLPPDARIAERIRLAAAAQQIIDAWRQGNRASAPIANLVQRLDPAPDKVHIGLDHHQLCEALKLPTVGCVEDIVIDAPITLKRRGIEAKLVTGGIMVVEPDAKLIGAIASARAWFTQLQTGDAASVLELAARHDVDRSHSSRTLPLAFLAPDIVRAIIEGRIDSDLTLSRIRRLKLPASWQAQRELLRIQ
jgi:hypothetical protein